MDEQQAAAEAAKVVAENKGFIMWALGGIAAAFTGLLALLKGYHGREIREMKSAQADTERKRREGEINIYRELGDHLKRDTDMHTETLAVLREQTKTLGELNTFMARELGMRPTREEVDKMIELSQGARPRR